MQKIKCPYCGYVMPLTRTKARCAEAFFIKCKGRRCGRIFEIKIPEREIK